MCSILRILRDLEAVQFNKTLLSCYSLEEETGSGVKIEMYTDFQKSALEELLTQPHRLRKGFQQKRLLS